MNVWMTRCRKRAKCSYCPEPILNTEPMVVATHQRGKWTFKRMWHPQCWIQQGLSSLEQRGEMEETRGKKRLDLPDEVKAKRFKLLARRASVLQRLKRAISESNLDKILHLVEMLEKYKEEIEPLGGVPESWKHAPPTE